MRTTQRSSQLSRKDLRAIVASLVLLVAAILIVVAPGAFLSVIPLSVLLALMAYRLRLSHLGMPAFTGQRDSLR